MLGIPLLEKSIIVFFGFLGFGFWFLGFLVSRILGFLVSKILKLLVAEFLGFEISKIRGYNNAKCPFNVF